MIAPSNLTPILALEIEMTRNIPLAIFALIGLLVAMFGYFLNIAAAFSEPYLSTTFILRVVGIFVPPLGSVMGLFA